MELYAIDQNVKILMSITLSVLAVSLYLIFKTKLRFTVMIYMLLSTIGDLFMTNFIDAGEANLFIGAGSFIVAHIIIGIAYVKNSKQKEYKYINNGFWVGFSLVIASMIIITTLAFTLPEKQNQDVVMYFLVLIYMAIIGFNICGNFSYSFNAKGNQYILPIAVILFYLSDIWIFLDMLNIYSVLHDYFVWYVYPFAQIFIIIFIDKFNTQK